MALLIKATGDKSEVVSSGPSKVCLDEGAKLDAKGQGGLTVWHERKGIIHHFDGRSGDRVKRQEATAKAREKSNDLAIAERTLASAEAQKSQAEDAAKQAADRAAQLIADAASKVAAAEGAVQAASSKPQPKKKAAKKKAVSAATGE